MYLLDTTFLIDYLADRENFIEKFRDLSERELYISVVSVAEVLSGDSKKRTEEIKSFLDLFIKVPVTYQIAVRAGEMRANLRRKGYKKSIADILIAQTAIEHNLILVTGNPKDFPQLATRKLLLPFP